MTSLTHDLGAQLQGAPAQDVARQLGIDPAQASTAIATALPLLMGALGRNTAQPQGAQALFGALQKDHSGLDIAGVLGAITGGGSGPQVDGNGILGHIFGGNQQRAESNLGQATGLGSQQSGQLLKILAPIVLAYLAKRMLSGNGDAAAGQGQQQASPEALGKILGQEHARVAQQDGVGGLLSSVLDQDGDGQLGIGDLLKIGGGLFGGKR